METLVSASGRSWIDEREFVGQSSKESLTINFPFERITYDGPFEFQSFKKEPFWFFKKLPKGNFVEIGLNRAGRHYVKLFLEDHEFPTKWTSDEDISEIIEALKTKLVGRFERSHARHIEDMAAKKKADEERVKYLERRSYFKRFSKRVRSIYQDSRKSDKKYGRENDLNLETIASLIDASSCSYCGFRDEKTIMTLDRVDSAIGHLKDNVVPSCYDCNLMRANMPYEPWVRFFAPAMKDARKSGLLGDWARVVRKKKVNHD